MDTGLWAAQPVVAEPGDEITYQRWVATELGAVMAELARVDTPPTGAIIPCIAGSGPRTESDGPDGSQ